MFNLLLTQLLLQVEYAFHYNADNPNLPFSYANLISFAIKSNAQERMTLADIYQWIINHFPYYKVATTGWKVTSPADLQF